MDILGTRTAKVAASDVTADSPALVVVDDRLLVAVFRDSENFYALDNRCPHRGASLSKGLIDAGHIICPLHHFKFNLETARCVMPQHLRIRKFEVRKEGETLVIELPRLPSATEAGHGPDRS